jgi:DNA-directed RNA polymerase subunit H (RpoH/RPB5)
METENSTQSLNYSPVFNKIYTSRNVILSILQKFRGFNIGDYENFSINELRAMYDNKELDMLVTNEDTGKKIYVKYHIDTKIKQTTLYDYIEDLFELETVLNNNDELVIITKDRVNDNIKAFLTQIYKRNNKFINIININDYLYNILEHKLVPHHYILNETEKNEIYKKYYISGTKNLPDISRFDPVAVAIGLRPGEVIEITRPSPTAITSMYYRICI